MINQEKKVNGVELTKLNADLKPLGYGRTYNYFPGKLKVSKEVLFVREKGVFTSI